MLLLGVFSSTPVGATELSSISASVASDRLAASGLGVEAYAALCLLSLLSPAPGNPVLSLPLIKHRERSALPDSQADNLLHLKGAMARAALAHTHAFPAPPNLSYSASLHGKHQRWLHLCGGNPERLHNSRSFGFSQLSIETLWSLTGILAAEKQLLVNPPSPPVQLDTSFHPIPAAIKERVMGILTSGTASGGSGRGSGRGSGETTLDPLSAAAREQSWRETDESEEEEEEEESLRRQEQEEAARAEAAAESEVLEPRLPSSVFVVRAGNEQQPGPGVVPAVAAGSVLSLVARGSGVGSAAAAGSVGARGGESVGSVRGAFAVRVVA